MINILEEVGRTVVVHEDPPGQMYLQIPPPVQAQLDRIEAKLDALLQMHGRSSAIEPKPVVLSGDLMVLQWLVREHTSALGECKGPSLDALIDLGLARILDPEKGDWARVEVTEKGREFLAALEKANSQ